MAEKKSGFNVRDVKRSVIVGGNASGDINNTHDTVHAGHDVTQVGGDYVRGDQIDARKAQGFINRPAGSVSQHFGDTVGGDHAAFAQDFAHIYETINTRPDNPDVSKDEITRTVKDIEQEAQKGEQANENKLTRWLNNLAGMAEDVFEVTVAALTGPHAAFATVARKVAERAKGERK